MNETTLMIFHRRIDTGDLDAVRAAVGPKTRIVWLESPTNPRQMISDIRVLQCYCSLDSIVIFFHYKSVSLCKLLLGCPEGEVNEQTANSDLQWLHYLAYFYVGSIC